MDIGAFFLTMRAVRLDDETADRMLAGVVDPADAPPGYAAVTELLETARSGAGVPVPATVAGHRPAHFGLIEPASVATAARRQRSRRRRVPVLAAVAFCAMTGGAYAAGATGAGSSTVSAVLDHIGVGSLVGASSGDQAAPTSGSAARKGEASAQTTAGSAATAPAGAAHDGAGKGQANGGKGHGAEISTLARTTDAQGVDKGAEISTAASGGKSHAGEHGNGHGGSHPAHPTHPTHPDHPAGGNGGGSKKPGS